MISPSELIAHLAAHLWMHLHRAATPTTIERSRECLQAFLGSFRRAIDRAFKPLHGTTGMREAALHFGSEILARTLGRFTSPVSAATTT